MDNSVLELVYIYLLHNKLLSITREETLKQCVIWRNVHHHIQQYSQHYPSPDKTNHFILIVGRNQQLYVALLETDVQCNSIIPDPLFVSRANAVLDVMDIEHLTAMCTQHLEQQRTPPITDIEKLAKGKGLIMRDKSPSRMFHSQSTSHLEENRNLSLSTRTPSESILYPSLGRRGRRYSDYDGFDRYDPYSVSPSPSFTSSSISDESSTGTSVVLGRRVEREKSRQEKAVILTGELEDSKWDVYTGVSQQRLYPSTLTVDTTESIEESDGYIEQLTSGEYNTLLYYIDYYCDSKVKVAPYKHNLSDELMENIQSSSGTIIKLLTVSTNSHNPQGYVDFNNP